MSRSSANLLLLVAGLVWGLGFIAQETAMDDIGPFLFMALRFSIAGIAILPLAVREARNRENTFPIERQDWTSIIGVGVIFFLAMCMQQVGLLATSVTNAGVLTGLYVVLVPLIALGAFAERQPIIIWPAALTAFLGIWLLGGGGISALSWGDWLVLLGAFFAALHVIVLGRTVTDLRRPALVASGQFLVSAALALLGFAVVRKLGWHYEPQFSLQTVWEAGPEILYASLFAGALAFTLMAICQQYTTASNAAVLMSSESLFAALGGALLLHERLTPLGYLGCGLLMGTIATVSFVSANSEQVSE